MTLDSLRVTGVRHGRSAKTGVGEKAVQSPRLAIEPGDHNGEDKPEEEGDNEGVEEGMVLV
jgi:hypothetical protein